MADYDFRIRQQRGKMRRVTFIVEDVRLKRRFQLREDARSDARGEMAEKKRSHDYPRSPKVRARLWVL
jgi:hypothetical protein